MELDCSCASAPWPLSPLFYFVLPLACPWDSWNWGSRLVQRNNAVTLTDSTELWCRWINWAPNLFQKKKLSWLLVIAWGKVQKISSWRLPKKSTFLMLLSLGSLGFAELQPWSILPEFSLLSQQLWDTFSTSAKQTNCKLGSKED